MVVKSSSSFAVCFLLVLGFLCCSIEAATATRWCCKSKPEFLKCQRLAKQATFKFTCVQALDTHECIQKIESGTADVIIVDAGDIFEYRDILSVVASEYINALVGATYYAVAAVKSTTAESLNLRNVVRYKTCHTGVGKTAGWMMPMGFLKRKNINIANIPESCAPGANSKKYESMIPGGNEDNKWCALCQGNGTYDEDNNLFHKCSRGQNERFYGYGGALRCMDSGIGDIAFIKHSTIEDTDENNQKYKLLCRDGTRASPKDWKRCNLGRVPSHALVTTNRATSAERYQIFDKLNSAWASFGQADKVGDGKNLLWGSKVSMFVKSVRSDPETFLGKDYFCNVYDLKYNVIRAGCDLTPFN